MKGNAMPRLRHGAPALLILLAGCMGDHMDEPKNFSVDSVNQPVVTANGATVPNCPNWKSAGQDSAAMTDSNYGCAVNSNLAAMIADPADLLHGKTDPATGRDADAAVKAIKAWRDQKPTGTRGIEKVSSQSAGSGGGGGGQ